MPGLRNVCHALPLCGTKTSIYRAASGDVYVMISQDRVGTVFVIQATFTDQLL